MHKDVQIKLIPNDISQKNNFDFLRLLFAFSVLIGHLNFLLNINILFPISAFMGVKGFFIISGFLVTRSFYNSNSTKTYFIKRAKRILPAYISVILLCAFCFYFISNIGLSDYFLSKTFIKYLLCNLLFLNFLQPYLPNVFDGSIIHNVNASLWSLKVEIMFYLCIIPIVCLINKMKTPNILFCLIYFLSYIFSVLVDYYYDTTGEQIYAILNRQFMGQFRFFITGAILLFNFNFLIKNKLVLSSVALPLFVVSVIFDNSLTAFFYPLSFGILIISVAFSFPFFNNIAKYGDISYSMYLWHFPVIQLLIHFGFNKYNTILTTVCSIIITTILSFASWHIIEKRFLYKNYIKKIINNSL